MGAYNLYKNEHNCHNQYTLNRILKGDWAFDGVVVSDWGGCHDTDQAVKNGLDMEFGSWTNGLSAGTSNAYENYYLATPYLKDIKSGKYTTQELDDKVRRVLRLFFRTTMNRQRPHGFLCSESHYEAARQIADEGIVLLQNRNNVLPIDRTKAKRILVVGENAIKMMTVGGGSSSLKVQRETLPLDGLRAKLGGSAEIDYARGYVGDVTGEYNGVETGQNLKDNRSADQLIAEAVEKAKNADYVIMVGGLNKSDYQDCEGHDRKQYNLPYEQNRLIEALAKVTDRLVYVNVSGNAVAMPWKDKVQAIVQSWFIGSEAGNAIADVLTGDANPSGKLPFTWYGSLNDCGAHALKTYPGTWRETDDTAAGFDKIIDAVVQLRSRLAALEQRQHVALVAPREKPQPQPFGNVGSIHLPAQCVGRAGARRRAAMESPQRMGETVEHGNFVQLHAQQLHFQAQEEILVDRLQKDRFPRRQSGRDGRRNGRTEQPEKRRQSGA